MTALKMTRETLNEFIVRLYELRCQGKTEEEILTDLGITADDLDTIQHAMLEKKADELRKKPTEHVYVEYMINQTQNIRTLDGMIGTFRETKQYNALVGAVRARSEILDKIIDKGQEFNVIRKPEATSKVVAGIVVSNLSSAELKKMALKMVGELSSAMKAHGERPIEELDVPPTHYALPPASVTDEAGEDVPAEIVEPAPPRPAPASRTVKAATGKVHGGRRVVKGVVPVVAR